MTFWGRWRDHAATRDDDLVVAVAGAGGIGTAVVDRVAATPGMRVGLVVNRTTERAVDALLRVGHDSADIEVVDDAPAAGRVMAAGRVPVSGDATSSWETPGIDVVVEVTGNVAHGARTILGCLDAGRDVVSVSAEADALLGPLFRSRARAAGAVYTIADGDQPGVLHRLVDEVRGYGFEVVAALNCKRHLDVHQDPGDSAGYSTRDKVSSRMSTAFGDGTKLQVEQSVVANDLGFGVLQRGMTGLRTTLADVAGDIEGLAGDEPFVDFTLGGDFGAGVAVVARPIGVVDEVTTTRLRFLKMGDGPLYTFFRPWHLVPFEVPRTLATVAMDRRPLVEVTRPPTTSVTAMAKRDLQPGDVLDGLGGYAVYGLVEALDEAAGHPPIGLLEDAAVTSAVPRDDPLTWEDVEVTDRELLDLWRQQGHATAPGG